MKNPLDSTLRSRMARTTFLTLVCLMPAILYAGPAILCHPIEIGHAKSLPSGNGPFGYDRHYDRRNLLDDTLGLLKPDMPILVRMETLRRATLYATRNLTHMRSSSARKAEDRALAFELLARIQARIHDSDHDKDQSLAIFDSGYLMQCFREAGLLEKDTGYEWVKRAIKLRGGDAEMQFACALMTKHRFLKMRRDQHLRLAQTGHTRGSLLERNLSIHFDDATLRF